MAKWCNDIVLDAALDKIATANLMIVCSGDNAPADRAAAIAAQLADVAMAPADFTIDDGVVSGRRVLVAQKLDVPIDATGDAKHIALCDDTDLLYVTTSTTQALTLGNNVTIPGWAVEIRDPTA